MVPGADNQRLDKLAGDSDSDVRAVVAESTNATFEQLDKLAGDSVSYVRKAVRKAIHARNIA